jgi:hypothetical protein
LGLINDPWCINNDAIIDEEMSENSKDSKDILALRKPLSDFDWEDGKWQREKVYRPDRFVIKLRRSNS